MPTYPITPRIPVFTSTVSHSYDDFFGSSRSVGLFQPPLLLLHRPPGQFPTNWSEPVRALTNVALPQFGFPASAILIAMSSAKPKFSRNLLVSSLPPTFLITLRSPAGINDNGMLPPSFPMQPGPSLLPQLYLRMIFTFRLVSIC